MQCIARYDGFESYYALNMQDPEVILESKRIFANYRLKGVIVASDMTDDTWIISDEKHAVKLNFGLNTACYEEHAGWTGCTAETYVQSVKSFTLMSMGKYVADTLCHNVRQLMKLVTRPIEEVEVMPQCAPVILEFLEFLPGATEARDQFMAWLEDCDPHPGSQSRCLANFHTYVLFEDALSACWKNASLEEKIRLFPIYLWWTLTVILPLRVTEFLLMPRDCLYALGEQSFISVRRTRLKGGHRYVGYRIQEDYECFTYPIPESLAADINWYIDATTGCRQSVLGTLFVPVDTDAYLNYTRMCTLLKHCLKQWNIPEEIHLGDTRHLSMISLILSGDTPSICKALANHISIQTSMGYYANMSLLTGCNVIRYLFENTVSALPALSSLTPVCTDGMFRVPDGYCDYQSLEKGLDPLECCKSWSLENGLGSCISCPHFHLDSMTVRVDLGDHLREDLKEDCRFLMDSIELLRKSIGKQSDISQIVMRLRNNMLRFLAFELKGDANDANDPKSP